MDLFYGNKRTSKKQYAYDIYGDFEEVEIDESKIIDDALDCIKSYKNKQKAGIKDITLQQFVSETSINLLDRQEKRITKLLNHPIWELETRIKELSKELSSNPDLSKQTDLELYSMALQRKQSSALEAERIQKNIIKLEEQVKALHEKQVLEKNQLDEYQAKQQAIEDNKFSEIRDSYNNIQFGQNLINSQHLLLLIEEYIKEKDDRHQKEASYIDDKLLKLRINDQKNLLRVHEIKIEYQIRELETLLADRGKNIFSEIHDHLKYDKGFNFLLNNHKQMKFLTTGANFDFVNYYVVIDDKSELGPKLERLYPRIFIYWKSLASEYNRSIDTNSIDLTYLSDEDENHFHFLTTSSYFYGIRKILIVPSFSAIGKYSGKEDDNIPNIIHVDVDGKSYSRIHQTDFRFYAIKDKIKILDGYDFFIDLKIFYELSKFNELSIEI